MTALEQIRRIHLRYGSEDLLQWWPRCTIHHTFMQASFDPSEHWSCEVSRCTEKRAAKMRTQVEKRIFDSARQLEK